MRRKKKRNKESYKDRIKWSLKTTRPRVAGNPLRIHRMRVGESRWAGAQLSAARGAQEGDGCADSIPPCHRPALLAPSPQARLLCPAKEAEIGQLLLAMPARYPAKWSVPKRDVKQLTQQAGAAKPRPCEW